MKIVLSHPTGNEFFRATARGFYDSGQLKSIYTAIATFPNSLLYRIGGTTFLKDIRRRSLDDSLKNYTHTYPWREAGRLLSMKLHRQKFAKHEACFFSVDAVYHSLDRHVASKLNEERQEGATGVYAYEDGALNIFETAHKLGLSTFYDLPIGYWRTMHSLLKIESVKNPQWADTLGGLKDSDMKLKRKDDEIALADLIIVASSFTRSTLSDYPGKLPKIKVVPYAFPAARPKKYSKNPAVLKLLFVGGLSQQKGLSYLFEAVRTFGDRVCLTVVGQKPNIKCAILEKELARHRYISGLPHEDILDLMQAHDLMIFPSLFEGFGQVITESMAQGTPVITTERTAGPDIIRNGENGWLTKAGCIDDIRLVLQEILDNCGLIELVGKEALETAKKKNLVRLW